MRYGLKYGQYKVFVHRQLELLNFLMDPVLNISRLVRFNKDFSAVEKMLR